MSNKIKIFKDDYCFQEMEDEVNKFIENKLITSIKYLIAYHYYFIIVLYEVVE